MINGPWDVFDKILTENPDSFLYIYKVLGGFLHMVD